jgi:hypothetical protein
MLDSMQTPTKTKLSRQEVLRAEAELLACVQSGSGNPQQQKQLAKAVQFAIDESTGPVAKPSPTRWEFPPAFREPHEKINQRRCGRRTGLLRSRNQDIPRNRQG